MQNEQPEQPQHGIGSQRFWKTPGTVDLEMDDEHPAPDHPVEPTAPDWAPVKRRPRDQ